MIAYLRAGLVLAVLSLTAWGGWTARAWLEDSRALDQAKQERDAAIGRERAAEANAAEAEAKAAEAEKTRAKIAGELAQEKAKIHDEVQTVVKRVPVYIGGSDCALDADGVRDLNAARGATLPDARRFVDDGPRTTRSDTP